MTWLIAQTLNEKQHSTDISLSLFKRDPTSPVTIPRSHPHNSPSFLPNHIPHCLSFYISRGMPFLSVSLPVHLFFFFCPFLTLLFSFSLSDL